MITVKYDPVGGKAIHDGAAHLFVQNVISRSRTDNVYVEVGNEFVLDVFRLFVARGDLDRNSITFCDSIGNVWDVTEYGVFSNDAPNSATLDLSLDIVKHALNRRNYDRVKELEEQFYLATCRSLP